MKDKKIIKGKLVRSEKLSEGLAHNLERSLEDMQRKISMITFEFNKQDEEAILKNIMDNKSIIASNYKDTIEGLSYFINRKIGGYRSSKSFADAFYDKLSLRKIQKKEFEITPQLILDDAKEYIKEVELIYNRSKNSIKGIQLNYEDPKYILNKLYETLYLDGIDIDFDEFSKHFSDDYEHIKPIKWLLTQAAFVYLFNNIKIRTDHKWKLLSQHFINSKGNQFDNKQLCNVVSNLESVKNHRRIEKIRDFIENIL